MNKIHKSLRFLSKGLICACVLLGISGCSRESSSRKFEMLGVEFTGDLTRDDLKSKIAGRDPDNDEKDNVQYKDIDGIEDLNGDLSVYFRTDGSFSKLIYELSDKTKYDDLKTVLISKYGEPVHSENVNDMRRTTYNYWKVSDDTALEMYRGTGYGGAWYNTYIQVFNLSEKGQENLKRKQEKYNLLQKSLENEEYYEEFEKYLNILDLKERPLDKDVIDKYNLTYQENSYDSDPSTFDFIGSGFDVMGEDCSLRVYSRNPNSKYGNDNENGKIQGVSVYLTNKNITKDDDDLLNKFIPIFGDWEWNNSSEKAEYDNGLFKTEISNYGSINTSLEGYYEVDTKYINVSSENEKYEPYETVDITPYVNDSTLSSEKTTTLFDSDGRTSSGQAEDIITSIQYFASKNTYGWTIAQNSEFDNDNYHCTNFDVYMNGNDTDLDLVVRADKISGEFKGLTYYSTENGESPNIETEDLARSYQGLILYTDSTLSYSDVKNIYSGSLNGGTTQNGRLYKISIENGSLMFDIEVE